MDEFAEDFGQKIDLTVRIREVRGAATAGSGGCSWAGVSSQHSRASPCLPHPCLGPRWCRMHFLFVLAADPSELP